MAKLLTEFVQFSDLSMITESDQTDTTKKHIKLEGVFIQAECKNKNGRIYPKTVLEREVNKYNEEYIKTNRAVGQLDHPDSPSMNLDRISHVIESLKMVDNDGYGTLRLIDTPMGKIAQTLVLEKILLGVSSRGVGNMEGDRVADSFLMITPADLVFENSAPKALVSAVLENKEWIMEGDKWVEVAVSTLQNSVDKKYSGHDINNYLQSRFREFIRSIK